MSTGGGARRNLGAKMDAEAARAAREGSAALELQPARHPNLELARRERDLLKEQLKGSPLKSGKVKQAEAAGADGRRHPRDGVGDAGRQRRQHAAAARGRRHAADQLLPPLEVLLAAAAALHDNDGRPLRVTCRRIADNDNDLANPATAHS